MSILSTFKSLPRFSIWMAPGILTSDCVRWQMKPARGPGHLSFFQFAPLVPLDLKVQTETSNSDHKNMLCLNCLRYAWWHEQLMCVGLCCPTIVPVGEHSLNKIGNLWSDQMEQIVRSGVYIYLKPKADEVGREKENLSEGRIDFRV